MKDQCGNTSNEEMIKTSKEVVIIKGQQCWLWGTQEANDQQEGIAGPQGMDSIPCPGQGGGHTDIDAVIQ